MMGPRLRRDEDLLLRVFVVNPRSAFSQLSAQLDFEHLAVIVLRWRLCRCVIQRP